MSDRNGKGLKTAQTPGGVNNAVDSHAPGGGISKKKSFIAADELKARFEAGAIPLQSDFSALIDMAEAGLRATGQATDQTGIAAGMRLSDTDQLELDVVSYSFTNETENSPIKLNTTTRRYVVDLENGLINKDNGINVLAGDGVVVVVDIKGVAVKAGEGVGVDSNGVAVKAGEGIRVDSDGVAVKAGGGISIDSNGVAVKAGEGISIDSDGVAVKAGEGISIDSDGVAVKAGEGISIDSDGVAVKAGGGIIVDSNGVSVADNAGIPKGLISLFSGSTIPTGWVLCDGYNGTPNLIDRFVMGGKPSNVHGQSSGTFSGSKNSKTCAFTTDDADVHIKGETGGHALTDLENGQHYHFAGMNVPQTDAITRGANDSGNRDSRDMFQTCARGQDVFEAGTSYSGSGDPHSHPLDLSSGRHSHRGSLTVPYYILAYIMKL